MSDQHSLFNFELYQPRETTPVATSRRGLLKAMMMEVHALSEKVDGKPTLKLADLAILTDAELAGIKPERLPECTISLREKMIWAMPPDAVEAIVLFPVASPALKAFNLFDGKHSIQEISQFLVEDTGWEKEKAWAYTRGLFLKLINMRVCVPK